ncbi:TolC family protein, partial [Klebsiella pneumoniae]|uniref:TolC family protein n=1 Tax=Klebsiella pneumoniae TaxID=573 RepID=UPI00385323D1
LAADARLRQTGYLQDEARAVQFPQLVLSAALGSQWTDVNAMDIGRARFSNLTALFAFPVFAGGRIQAGIRAADAHQREAVAAYEEIVLEALAD